MQFGFAYPLHQLPLLISIIHLVLLLVFLFTITWFYKRKSMEQDYEIMYGRRMPLGSLFILRFLTPICLIANIVSLILWQIVI